MVSISKDCDGLEVKSDIKSWVDFFRNAEIPVLKRTSREMSLLQMDEENLSARAITLLVMSDPMMAFRVLSYSQKHKSSHQIQDLLQVEQAILMMGTTPFFRNLPTDFLVEDILRDRPVALTHLLQLIHRSHRAANYASNWATHLIDMHAEEVRTAALLHDLTEMLMWCFSPDKMNLIYEMQHADRTLRSASAQQQVFGFNFQELQKELVKVFQLPPLLNKLMQDSMSKEQRVRNVTLAVNLARHSSNGWDDAALPDDYHEIAGFLRINLDRVIRIVGVPTSA